MRAMFAEIHDHAMMLGADVYFGTGRMPTVWQRASHWAFAVYCVAWFAVGAFVCRWFGHSTATVVEDFVDADYADVPDDGLYHRPRVVDVNGGGCDWFCPRCGQGGRSWF